MIELVMVPVSWEMSREAAMMAHHTGELDQIRESRVRESADAKSELARLLNTGYAVIGSPVTVNSSNRVFLAYTLYRPDNDIPF